VLQNDKRNIKPKLLAVAAADSYGCFIVPSSASILHQNIRKIALVSIIHKYAFTAVISVSYLECKAKHQHNETSEVNRPAYWLSWYCCWGQSPTVPVQTPSTQRSCQDWRDM